MSTKEGEADMSVRRDENDSSRDEPRSELRAPRGSHGVGGRWAVDGLHGSRLRGGMVMAAAAGRGRGGGAACAAARGCGGPQARDGKGGG